MTNYDISEIKGDTWDGAEFTVTVASTGEPVDLTGASILLTVRTAPESPVSVHTMTVDDGLVLTNPAAGKWGFDPDYLWPMPAGQYVYAARFTLANGRKKTWLKGVITLPQDTNRA
jgi:hypothetical protein